MFQKNQIETILKINGVSINATPEEIKEVLLRASYNDQEIEAAIAALRNSPKEDSVKFSDLQKIFVTSDALKPAEISALLGIEVRVGSVEINHDRKRELSIYQILVVTVLATVIALVGIATAMYIYKVGLFHPTATAFGSTRIHDQI